MDDLLACWQNSQRCSNCRREESIRLWLHPYLLTWAAMFLWGRGQGFLGRHPISWRGHADFHSLFSKGFKAWLPSVNSRELPRGSRGAKKPHRICNHDQSKSLERLFEIKVWGCWRYQWWKKQNPMPWPYKVIRIKLSLQKYKQHGQALF